MRICSIDSSGLVAGVAITDNDITIADYSIQYKITHSQTLLPMLDEVVRRIGMDISEIDAFAVAAGPGSFTGLRIGSATIKGLGLVTDKPVIAVPTLEALAYNAYGTDALVCPIMDARRHQVYTGIYSFEFNSESGEYEMNSLLPQTACEFDELVEKLNELGHRVMFIGDGIPVFEEDMRNKLEVEYSVAPAHMNRQRAAALGALAAKYMAGKTNGLEGTVTTADEFVPVYLRLSQAEREKKEREGEN